MPKKSNNQMILKEKDKSFLYYYYSQGKTLAESYNLSHSTNIPESIAAQRGFQQKKFLESFEDFRQIIRQFCPVPTLGAHMADIAFSSKDPNLRHKGQKLVAQCLGMLEPDEGQGQAGFTVNVLAGSAAVQVNAGDGAPDRETIEEKKVEKIGKPISFIK